MQLNQALAGKFNAHVHVEYEWRLQHEDLDESDEDLDEKVRGRGFIQIHSSHPSWSHCSRTTCNAVPRSPPPTPLQPSPHRRDERPVSCYAPGANSHLHGSPGPGARDGAGKEKQRGYVTNLVNNETYGTILNNNPPLAGGPGGPKSPFSPTT